MTVDISIIILNWNGADDTVNCINSLFKSDYKNFNIIIVDNGSTDGSLTEIKKALDGRCLGSTVITEDDLNSQHVNANATEAPVTILALKANYGYVKGNNIGMDFSLNHFRPNYVFLLNNDTIVPRNAIRMLRGSFDQNIKIVGPRIIDHETGEVQSEGVIFNRRTGQQIRKGWSQDESRIGDETFLADYVSGCAMMISSSIFPVVGYLDEEYVNFWEETDFCFRARKFGYLTACNRGAEIIHKGSASFSKVSDIKEYYMTRNRFIFFKKYSTTTEYISINIYNTYYFARRLGYLLTTKNKKNIGSLLKGTFFGLIYSVNNN